MHPKRSLDPSRAAELVHLVLGDDAPSDAVARLLDRTDGDLAQLLVHLLVMVQGGLPDDLKHLGFGNGAGPGGHQAKFRLEGDHWRLTFAGVSVHLRDSRGLRYLAALLDRPGEAVHALDLVRRGNRKIGTDANPDRARQTVTKCIGLALAKVERCHPTLAAHLRASVRRGMRCTYLPVQDT